MKVEIIDRDPQVFQLLEKHPSLQVKRVHQLSREVDLIVISGSSVHYNDLSEKLSEVEFRQACYLVSPTNDPNLERHVRTICEALGVHLISSSLYPGEVMSEILSIAYPEEVEGSRVAAFFAPIANIGTTSTCLSTALAISRLTTARVGVLGLNAWDDSTDQLDYKGDYLNKLRSKLSNHLLEHSPDQLLSYFHKIKKDEVYFLAGNQNIKMERLYSSEEITSLIRLSKDLFDVLILDAGCHFDNANMLESLRQADLKFLVMNQQRKAIKKFNQSFKDILFPLGYNLSEFSLILNRYSDETGIPNDKEIISEMNIPFVGKIPDVALMGLHSEVQKNILHDYGDQNYMNSIEFISKTIINRAKLKMRPLVNETTHKSVWKLFAKLGAGA